MVVTMVGKTNKAELAKRRRRLKITKAKAAELLSKKDELHPVAAAIVEAVHTNQLEEVVVYASPEPVIPAPSDSTPDPKKKTWWESLWE